MSREQGGTRRRRISGGHRGAVAVLLIAMSIVCLSLLGVASARADALCDQMREQYGAGWPCINVPTYTPQPTQNTPPPTTGNNGGPGGGPAVGGNPGPGPGEGNGTPIVPVPGASPQPAAPEQPVAPQQPAAPTETPPATGAPVPATISTTPSPVPSTPRVPTAPGAPTVGPTPPRVPDNTTDDGAIPLVVWLLVGAAAAAAGAAGSTVRRDAAAVVPSDHGDPRENLNPIIEDPDVRSHDPPAEDSRTLDSGADGGEAEAPPAAAPSVTEPDSSSNLPLTPIVGPEVAAVPGPVALAALLAQFAFIAAAIIVAALLAIMGLQWLLDHRDELDDIIRDFFRDGESDRIPQDKRDELDREIRRRLPPPPAGPSPPGGKPPRSTPSPGPLQPGDPAQPDSPAQPYDPQLPGDTITPDGQQPGDVDEPGSQQPGDEQLPNPPVSPHDPPFPGEQQPNHDHDASPDEPTSPDQVTPGQPLPDVPELPGQRPPSDHQSPIPDPDALPFGVPQTPEGPDSPAPSHPPLDEPGGFDQFIGQILRIIAQLLTPPDPPDPNTDLNPDGSPTDQYVQDAIGDLAQQVADLAAALGNEIAEIANKSAQGYGSGVHSFFRDLVDSELNGILQDLFGDDYAAHAEVSILKVSGLIRDPGTGRIVWVPSGTPGTVRPDLIVTRMVTTTANGVAKISEEIVLIIDLKTGNAEISRAWRTAVVNASGVLSSLLSSVTPYPLLSQPPKSAPSA